MNISLRAGAEFDFGTFLFTEAEIIRYARENDPLDFHLSAESAKKHFFRDLVASGPHAFHVFYTRKWIPKFGPTVLAGLGVDNWRFLKPIYRNDEIKCRVFISEANPHPEHDSVTIRWNFNFENIRGELVQHLEMLVLHHDFTQ